MFKDFPCFSMGFHRCSLVFISVHGCSWFFEDSGRAKRVRATAKVVKKSLHAAEDAEAGGLPGRQPAIADWPWAGLGEGRSPKCGYFI